MLDYKFTTRIKIANINIFKHKYYWFYYSLFYSIILTLSFYPGILYSDSVYRWKFAIDIANRGFSILNHHSDFYPIFPGMFMSFFYFVTKEIGFFIFVQSFFFSSAVFHLVYFFRKNIISNIIISIFLIISINTTYSRFHSYDTLFAIFYLYFVIIILKLVKQSYTSHHLILLIVLTFCLTATRLNSLFSIIVIIPLIYYYLQKRILRHNLKKYLVILLLFAVLPTLLTRALVHNSNQWARGTIWEYVSLAAKSKNNKYTEFISKLGFSPEEMSNAISYKSIYEHSILIQFIDKVQGNTKITKSVIQHYLEILFNEPLLFMSEKIKYISSILGLRYPLSEGESHIWYFSNTFTKDFNKLGSYNSSEKINYLNQYKKFIHNYDFILRPYLIFCLGLLVCIITFFYIDKPIGRQIFILNLLSISYYSSFFITWHYNEFRYFFPSFHIIQCILIIFLILIVEKIMTLVKLKIDSLK